MNKMAPLYGLLVQGVSATANRERAGVRILRLTQDRQRLLPQSNSAPSSTKIGLSTSRHTEFAYPVGGVEAGSGRLQSVLPTPGKFPINSFWCFEASQNLS